MHNLKKIQEVIDKNPENPDMGEIYLLSIEEYGLPEDNMLVEIIEFNNNEIPGDYNEKLEELRRDNPSKFPSKPKPYCRINGTIYNLSFIQDILDGKIDKTIPFAMFESGIFGEDMFEAMLFEDVIVFNNNEIPLDYNAKLDEARAYNRAQIDKIPRPKCPTCSSTNIRRLGFWENYSYCPKTFVCNNCGYEW